MLFLLPFCAIAQHNFSAVDSNVVWQLVFNDTLSAVDYMKHINKNISQEHPVGLIERYTSGQFT